MDMTTIFEHDERAIVDLLSHHYGDGGVYLPRNRARSLLQAAIARGFVSDEGYVTRKGRALLARASAGIDLRG